MGHTPEHYAPVLSCNHFKFAFYGPASSQVRYVVAQLTTSSHLNITSSLPNISLFISSSQ